MENVNWEEIKTEYITTSVSQRKLAEKHGVSYCSLKDRSVKEGWVSLREQYRRKTLAKALSKASSKEANRLSKLMDTTTKAIDVIARAFSDEDQFNRYLVEVKEEYVSPVVDEGDGAPRAISERQWTEEKIFKKLDTKAIRDLTSALKELTGLTRDFYNIPTPAQAEAQRIASERLELDRIKAESDKEDKGDITVIFEAGPEGWNE